MWRRWSDQVQTLASDYGTYSQDSHGILFNISARPRNGLVFQGGVNTGTTRTDNCEVRALLPEETTPRSRRPIRGATRRPAL